ncbi:CRISPR system precrRNA processing endoribonuclease RAMP protein Cas6 [Selenihalanaerobacter shriftii]|uniref:CRISPR-associated endoribonuclease Cas6 n=1 Tax=Selenihalanaerobacter shriftii TaxID=142842 RepID=A0A1T4PHL9_9FIRM|nr:CRISPR system precrRNA processing endoribonuclease RAMP protein Cas6 [Selenihalanaerobacter shriftii]SJZ91035.1 CRISPR-associated endoribonuclease Cas6 [Selenihalanaerobacter shriftii]
MNLDIVSLEITLIAKDTIKLPKHPGSTFRGAFGHALKSFACVMEKKRCKECSLNSNCAYSILFNPILVGKEKFNTSNRFKDKPRPFVFEPKTNGKEIFHPGQEINFRLNLFGSTYKFLPYILESWRYLEDQGLGKGRGKFIVSEVWSLNDLTGKAERIYSEYANRVHNSDIKIISEDIEQLQQNISKEHLRLKLLTPMLLKYKGDYVKKIDFHILMRNLFRRVSSLSYFYGKDQLDINFGSYLERAEEVKLIKNHTNWRNWKRYSSRQKQRIKMYGVTGELEYEGDLGEFLPYLILGQYTHVGKNTVFGLGDFKILKNN